MLENILNFFKKFGKNENKEGTGSKNKAKERLHLVLMQDRANVSADFLEMMKQEIIEVIKKYIEVDEKEIDVRLTNEAKEDGTTGAPSLYANIPIVNIRSDMKKEIEEENKSEKIENAEQEEKEQKDEVKEEEENKEEKKNVEKKEDNGEPAKEEKRKIKKDSAKKSTVKKTTNQKTAVKKA